MRYTPPALSCSISTDYDDDASVVAVVAAVAAVAVVGRQEEEEAVRQGAEAEAERIWVPEVPKHAGDGGTRRMVEVVEVVGVLGVVDENRGWEAVPSHGGDVHRGRVSSYVRRE